MIADLSPSDRSKYACALHASKLVESGMKVGLGTGSTAYWLVHHLAERVRNEAREYKRRRLRCAPIGSQFMPHFTILIY